MYSSGYQKGAPPCQKRKDEPQTIKLCRNAEYARLSRCTDVPYVENKERTESLDFLVLLCQDKRTERKGLFKRLIVFCLFV